MPGFDGIIGQATAVGALLKLLEKRNIPHALLFTGIPGIGKRSCAKRFAMALNCRAAARLGRSGLELPCGECRTCVRIQKGVHPDVLLLEPRKTARRAILNIDQIRQLLGTLAMRPHSANYRVVIVADAQAMNAESGNALLKMLEEPPDGTVLILTAHHKSDLLPTIVSRCRHIRFNPLTPADIFKLMKGSDADQAELVACLAGGSYAKALALSQGQGWHGRRNWLVCAAGLADSPRPTPATALAAAAQLAQDHENIEDWLLLLQTWIRDLTIWPSAPEMVVNRDSGPLLERTRRRLSDRQLMDLWDVVQKAQKDIAANANLRLTLETMALGMYQKITGSARGSKPEHTVAGHVRRA